MEERKKSNKKVLSLEESCHKYRCVFVLPNVDNQVMVSVNCVPKYYPLNQEVEVEESHWHILKDINKVRKLFVEPYYNPFEDEIYKD